MVSVLDVQRFQELLQQSWYLVAKMNFVLQGFREGFDIGYQGPVEVVRTAPNLKLRVGLELILWNKVMKEVGLKHFVGPFAQVPFEHYIQSPIGLVPKDNGNDTRLIFHLSYPHRGTTSVNANMPQELCHVRYPDIDDAIRMVLALGASPIYLSKSDFKSAFRILGLNPRSWRWLVLKAWHPITKNWQFFFDKCLPFSSSISCALSQAVSDAIAHIVRFKTGKDLVNYLDDYLFAALMKIICDGQLQMFLDICKQIRFPVSLEKTIFGDTCITFLGFLLDGKRLLISIPVEKVEKAKTVIQQVLVKRKVTIHQIQKLCGLLNFLCRAIVPGRAFTRQIYSTLTGFNLRPHHHVLVKAEVCKDLQVWLQFLSHPLAFCRPFIDSSHTLQVDQLLFYTDSSCNPDLGFDGICQESWMYSKWTGTSC